MNIEAITYLIQLENSMVIHMRKIFRNTAFFISILVLATISGRAYGQASIEIASVPLQVSGKAKPNILLLLDDSISMQSTYTGDEVLRLLNRIGYRSHLCNAQYYNPDVRYMLPTKGDGSLYETPSFTNAPYEGFRSNSVSTNLSNGFRAWRSWDTVPKDYDADCWESADSVCRSESGGHANGSDRAYYYAFIGTDAARAGLGSAKLFADPENDRCWIRTMSSPDASANWKKVEVNGTSGPAGNVDERQNFAIWYSFYRTRLQAMKSAISIAFQSLDEQFRIGLSTINYTGTDNASSRFVNIGDFNAAQRVTFYRKMQEVTTDSGTPLRGALSKAGRIYAGKLGTDPMQHSCQKNFSMIATDGGWNATGEGRTFGPLNMDGVEVGNADGNLLRPKYDGSTDGTGTRNTLADVAAYFRHTDLRPGSNCKPDLCSDNVPGPNGSETFQHMNTYGVGLGITGTLQYRDDYATAVSGDFADIRNGNYNWPDPGEGNAQRVDDLWHAAVNGDGRYFNTQNITQLQAALKGALDAIVTQSGTDSPIVFDATAGQASRALFASSFRSSTWDGDLVASGINMATGQAGERLWSAGEKLDARVAASDSRVIYLYDALSLGKLKPFQAALLSTQEKTVLASACSGTQVLSQCSRLSAAQKTALNDNMVAFLRGQARPEALFRKRAKVLGDIVNSAPLYVGRPDALADDSGYQDFAAANRDRMEMVYVGANDGMLHAFSASTGDELWAYIPPPVLPRLTSLADQRYSSRHQFLVDGSAISADICIVSTGCSGNQWRTLLVGGFGAGAKGYYALDITDPARPQARWNFNSDANLGLSFGNPVITRLPGGTWAVVFASGYNNALGGGFLYVLNAWTGVLLKKIATGVGSGTQQSGLARITLGIDGQGTTVHGGDLLGNLWRFNIDPAVDAASSVARVASFRDASELAQPISTAPLVARAFVGNQLRNLILVGTGRYLGQGDRASIGKQTLYVLDAAASTAPLDNPRSRMAQQTLSEIAGVRAIDAALTVDWSTQAGWYMDLDPGDKSPGERINIDMRIDGSLLTFAGNVPGQNPCERGSAYFYALDLRTGAVRAPSSGTAITRFDGGLLVGFTPRQTGNTLAMLLVADSGRQASVGSWQINAAIAKRVSWRELAD